MQDLDNINPDLDPGGLKNNGGPTDTIAIVSASSPAIGTGINPLHLLTDQRGYFPPPGVWDIGAYQYNATPPPGSDMQLIANDQQGYVPPPGAGGSDAVQSDPPPSEGECDASQWNLDRIHFRLDESGADAELIDLTKQCLAKKREDRPRHAGVVAARIAGYRSGVEELLRKAEIARFEADARAGEETKRRQLADELAKEAQGRAALERRRRKLALALAAAILALGMIVVAVAAIYLEERQASMIRLNAALQEFTMLESQARSDPGGDVAKWHAAVESIRRAESNLGPFADVESRRNVTALYNQVVEAEADAKADQSLLRAIVDIRSARADDADGSQSDQAYAVEFRAAGIDVDALGARPSAALITNRPPSTALTLAASLDDWAFQRRRYRPGARDDWMRLLATASAADPDPLRSQLRQFWAAADPKGHGQEVARMAKCVDFKHWPVQSVILLATVLSDCGDRDAGIAVLHRAQSYHPDDVWINYGLARQLDALQPPQIDEAIQFYSVARALVARQPTNSLMHLTCGAGETRPW